MTNQEAVDLQILAARIKNATEKSPVRARDLGKLLQSIVTIALSTLRVNDTVQIDDMRRHLGEEWSVLEETAPSSAVFGLFQLDRYGIVLGYICSTNKKVYTHGKDGNPVPQDLDRTFDNLGRRYTVNFNKKSIVLISDYV